VRAASADLGPGRGADVLGGGPANRSRPASARLGAAPRLCGGDAEAARRDGGNEPRERQPNAQGLGGARPRLARAGSCHAARRGGDPRHRRGWQAARLTRRREPGRARQGRTPIAARGLAGRLALPSWFGGDPRRPLFLPASRRSAAAPGRGRRLSIVVAEADRLRGQAPLRLPSPRACGRAARIRCSRSAGRGPGTRARRLPGRQDRRSRAPSAGKPGRRRSGDRPPPPCA